MFVREYSDRRAPTILLLALMMASVFAITGLQAIKRWMEGTDSNDESI